MDAFSQAAALSDPDPELLATIEST